MQMWEFQDGRRTRVVKQSRLLRNLVRGRYEGGELVRPFGEKEWRPIREVTELAAAGPGSGSRRSARIQGLVWSVGIWAICSYFFLPRPAILIWGLFVALQAIREIPRILAAEPTKTPLLDPAPGAGSPEVNGATDPFLAELRTALDALQRGAEKKGLPAGVDLQALRDAAHDLRRRHLALLEIAEPAARERLVKERDDALSQASRAQDPRTIEVLQQQALSVSERIGALDQAADVSARLQARERTLLHQIEALRLSILQSGVDEGKAPDLAREVQRLKLEIKADAEVETHLARARIGTRQAQ